MPENPTKEKEEEIKRQIELLKEKFQGLPQYPVEYRSYREILPRNQRQFSDYEKQVEHLKEHFCNVPNEETCRQTLQRVTYFRLKGYFAPLQKDFAFELQKPLKDTRVPFSVVTLFYERDERMRLSLLQILHELEIFLRSQLSYLFSKRYGAYGYLEKDNYFYRKSDSKRKHYHNHERLLSDLLKLLQNNQDRVFVQHYLNEYGGVMPLWTVSELMTFGDLTRFYADWKDEDKKLFIKSLYGTSKEKLQEWKYTPRDSSSWMNNCRALRNVCAHGGQLYNRIFPWTPNLPIGFQEFKDSNLWSAILAMRFLYPDSFYPVKKSWNERVTPRIKKLLDMSSVDASEAERNLLNKLLRKGWGFPDNWEDWFRKWDNIR